MAHYADQFPSNLPGFQDIAQAYTTQLAAAKTAFNNAASTSDGILPTYVSGARALIKCAGKSVGVCTSINWSVSNTATEIRTVDSGLPWDLAPNQMSISASLSQIMDPRKGPEAQGLFSTMQAYIHQPYVEIQVLDSTGSSLFFARGMFTSMSSNINLGQLGTVNASFQGVLYQGNVFQQFTPYDPLFSALNKGLDSAVSALSNLSGGFL